MRLLASLVCLFLVSCVRPVERPLVPTLRYDGDEPTTARSPTEDAPFRTSAPTFDLQQALSRVSVEPFELDNGLRGFVVQRHGFPMIVARLVIETRALEVGDVGGARAALISGLFLSPPEGELQTAASCGTVFCSVGSRGTSAELGDVLGRIASLATRDDRPETFYKQRLDSLVPLELQSGQDPTRSFKRITSALLFGQKHRYGQTVPRAPPTLEDLRALRRHAFDPKRAALFVVGDVSFDEVRDEATRRFGAWQGEVHPTESAPDPPLRVSGPRTAAFYVPPMVHVTGAIVARGPPRTDGDFVAFQLLGELLGGAPTSEAFQHVREEMTAAYSVGSWIESYPEVSVIGLGGSFDRDKAIDGLERLLESVGAARNESPTPEALEGAKRALLARWRQAMATDEGIANVLGTGLIEGLTVAETLDYPTNIRRVQPSQVQAVARRYLAVSALRIVLVGDPEFLVEAQALRFGAPIRVDGFGQPM
jgi:hypothetical protein